jgi:signal transduction histidine kinase
MLVKDNGIGFDADAQKEQSYGLLGIRERALMVGGKARITSKPGKGTRVSVSLPYQTSHIGDVATHA